jgi:hypothetical protein
MDARTPLQPAVVTPNAPQAAKRPLRHRAWLRIFVV